MDPRTDNIEELNKDFFTLSNGRRFRILGDWETVKAGDYFCAEDRFEIPEEVESLLLSGEYREEEDKGHTVAKERERWGDDLNFYREVMPAQEVFVDMTGEEYPPAETIQYEPKQSPLAEILEERGRVYGDPQLSHKSIGLAWTASIQNHYGLELQHPIPCWLVAQMMESLKIVRSARVYKQDNYDDRKNYTGFAEQWQREESTGLPPGS